MENSTKQKAANALTDTGVEFKVDQFTFCIRKLKLGTLIQISEASLCLSPLSEETKSTDIIKTMYTDALVKARVIALAIINSQPIPHRPKKSLFEFGKKTFDPKYLDEHELTDFFLKSLDSEQMNAIVNVIISQMGINDFFQSTVSLIGIDLLKEISKTVTDQLTPSGEK